MLFVIYAVIVRLDSTNLLLKRCSEDPRSMINIWILFTKMYVG